MDTEKLLEERKSSHGEYAEHAACTQQIVRTMMSQPNWPTLNDMQKETLHMIAHKVGRILTGNPDVADHYDDIAGYAKLISQRLAKPVTPRNFENDPYMAFALAWNMPMEQATEKLHALIDAKRQRPPVTAITHTEPAHAGSPADGGHHGISDDDITSAIAGNLK